jgi:exodeoxyribonuclease-3
MNTKIITFNVNGLRSILTKAKNGTKLGTKACNDNVITRLLDEIQPDVLCLQEVRCNSNQDLTCLNLQTRGYEYFTLHCAQRKGYSGTAIISKKKPLHVQYGFLEYDDNEGRSITVEYDNYQVINVYVPNSKADLSRLDFRINTWDVMLRQHINMLQNKHPLKPVILCGDLNVAHENIDVHNSKTAIGSHGFTQEERNSFKNFLTANNMVDAFRNQHSSLQEYSWFSPFAQSRKYNKGWRIDYILVQKELIPYVEDTKILSDYYGSDHVPCFISLKSPFI